MKNKHRKRCSTLFVLENCNLKQQNTTIHLSTKLKLKTKNRKQKNKYLKIAICNNGAEQQELPLIVSENAQYLAVSFKQDIVLPYDSTPELLGIYPTDLNIMLAQKSACECF